ncbi:hypothetical protein [Catenulispora rubra]|uniref:hypothetical protein n=1 Tax=Catenulispora rubra TaxID=280293 RepID=UPI001892727F|nr:hypothetical protein [Catenulispora rubra]
MSTANNAGDATDLLETSYRKALRLLPRTYQAQHAEEMLGVLMDGAEPGQSRPKAREVLSVAMLGLRLRLTVVDTGGPTGRLAADIARRAILVYFIFEFGLLMQWNAFGARIGYSFLPVLFQAGIIVALIRGWSWCAQALCLANIAYIVHNMQWQYWNSASLFSYGGFSVFARPFILAVAVVVFHRKAPRIAGSAWWFTALAGITVAFWIRGKTVDHMWEFDDDFSHTPALPALLFAAAVVVALWRVKSSSVWPAALALAGLPVFDGPMLRYLTGLAPQLADSPRDTFYVELALGCEVALMCVALASFAFAVYLRRTTARGGEAA